MRLEPAFRTLTLEVRPRTPRRRFSPTGCSEFRGRTDESLTARRKPAALKATVSLVGEDEKGGQRVPDGRPTGKRLSLGGALVAQVAKYKHGITAAAQPTFPEQLGAAKAVRWSDPSSVSPRQNDL